jgi:hypothetical protein
MNQISHKNAKFKHFLLNGFIVGIISTLGNNLYNILYKSLTNIQVSDFINLTTITSASMLLPIIGSMYYFALNRITDKAFRIFIITTSIIVIISLFGPLQGQLPNGQLAPMGWIGLTIPMHILTGLISAWFIPSLVKK